MHHADAVMHNQTTSSETGRPLTPTTSGRVCVCVLMCLCVCVCLQRPVHGLREGHDEAGGDASAHQRPSDGGQALQDRKDQDAGHLGHQGAAQVKEPSLVRPRPPAAAAVKRDQADHIAANVDFNA